MISVQHRNYKVTLVNAADAVHVRLYLCGRLVGSAQIVDLPFHVVADRAYDWVRARDWPTPADLTHLNR